MAVAGDEDAEEVDDVPADDGRPAAESEGDDL